MVVNGGKRSLEVAPLKESSRVPVPQGTVEGEHS